MIFKRASKPYAESVEAEAELPEAKMMDCGHAVYPPESYGWHMPLYWDNKGIDTCMECEIPLQVWTFLMDSFSDHQRRVWDEAAWYVAEKNHIIAELNETIEHLENGQLDSVP